MKIQVYKAPNINIWGTVRDLTQVGNTNPDSDLRGGSVFPPGHDKDKDLKQKKKLPLSFM